MFEWDSTKNQANIEKHGIDFEEAKLIFEGRTIEVEDSRKDYGEIRMQVLGEMKGYILYVVYTFRGENRRIISARLANQEEREVYDGKN